MTTTERRTVTTGVRASLFLSRVGHVPAPQDESPHEKSPQGKFLGENTTGNLLTTGSNQLRVRDHNQLLVLQAIRVQGPLTRRVLAEITGLTFQTVENISKRLIDAGIVQDSHPANHHSANQQAANHQAANHQPANHAGRSRHLSLRPAGAHAIGIARTPTGCEVALCDVAGRTVATKHLRTDHRTDPADVLRWLSWTVPDLVDDANVPVSTVLGAGIITSPASEEPGRFATLWPGPAEIARQLHLPTVTGNSVLAAVCGEQWTGHMTARDAVYVHLDQAIGGAIVSNGQLNTGATGGSGNIAHLPAEQNGRRCACGRQGCLNTLIGESRLRSNAGQAIGSPEPPSITAIAELAQTDPAIAALVQRAADQLIRALLPAVQLLDPEVIILGGRTVDALGESIRARMSERLAETRGPAPVVVLARPAAGQAASAATLVLQRVFTPTVDHLLLGHSPAPREGTITHRSTTG